MERGRESGRDIHQVEDSSEEKEDSCADESELEGG